MELFDKRFVYLEWDDKLEGKKVFIGDTLPQLRVSVNGHLDSLQGVSKNVSDDSFYPFISPCGIRYAMVYYDPNYSCKVAYAQGKKIQFKFRHDGDGGEWKPCTPQWRDDCEYRVKPEMPDCYILSMSHAPSSILSIDKNIYPVENEMILSKGTEEECKDYAVENYCKRCIHEVSICCSPRLGCQGFKEKESRKLRVYRCSDDTLHISPYCIMTDFLFEGMDEECKQYINEHYCSKCAHQSCDMIVGTQFCKGFKKHKKKCEYKTCKHFSEPDYLLPCRSCLSKVNYEPKKKRRKTNRELARWLAQGNGQAKNINSSVITSPRGLMYDEGDDNKPCPDYLVIRGWDEAEWHEPEVEE